VKTTASATSIRRASPPRFKLVAEALGLPEAPAPDKVFTNKYLPPKATG